MTPQELKSSILQLAIQGKLVEHLESEKGVAVHSSYDSEAADLFEIPDNWKWLAIKDVATVVTGLSFKKQEQKDASNGSLRVLRGGNIGDDYKYYFYEDDIYVDLEQFKSKYVPLLKGDVITPSVTSMEKICKTGFVDKDFTSVTAGGFVYIIRNLSDDIIDAKYLLYFISSTFNKEQCKPNIHKSGQAFYNLKKSGFIEQPICVPPLAEQKRIVAKIEELLPYIDRYEQAWTRLEDFNKRFPIDMQKSLLQWAIQGKLVEQRPEDGTAEELYRQIQQEKRRLMKEGKIKKEKPLPEIAEDEVPFEIPGSWKWVRLGEISVISGGFAFKSANYTTDGVRVVRISDFNELGFVNDKIVRHPYNESLNPYVLEAKNILLCMTGGTVGKSLFVTETNEKMVVNQRVATIKVQTALPEYIYQVILAPVTQKVIQYNKNSTNDNISIDTIKDFSIPLPPLAEQKRIVAKLEELLPLCEQLK